MLFGRCARLRELHEHAADRRAEHPSSLQVGGGTKRAEKTMICWDGWRKDEEENVEAEAADEKGGGSRRGGG
eukprot:3819358-Pyramimonas_sp.AAC.1